MLKTALRVVTPNWPDDGPADTPTSPVRAPRQAKVAHAPATVAQAGPARPEPPPRRHVTPDEAGRLVEAAGQAGRNGTRDRALVLLTYRHGLRVAEATALRWSAIDWTTEQIHIGRVKRGISGHHPVSGTELRILRKLKREAEDNGKPEGHIFISEQGGPMSPDMVARIVTRAGVIAGIGFHVHPHMLRHGAGYKLVRDRVDLRTIQGYLGHAQVSSTVRYTRLDPGRFEGLWKD